MQNANNNNIKIKHIFKYEFETEKKQNQKTPTSKNIYWHPVDVVVIKSYCTAIHLIFNII